MHLNFFREFENTKNKIEIATGYGCKNKKIK